MSRYEGLSLPQLLDLMHDLVRPEPVPWTPQTIGWAVIATWFLVVLALVIWQRIKLWRRNRYRRAALAELRALGAQPPQGLANGIATILKRTALAAYGRDQVAPLYGDQWASFLRESAANDPMVAAHADALASAAYRPDIDGGELLAPARRWIEVHRA